MLEAKDREEDPDIIELVHVIVKSMGDGGG